MQVRIDMSEYMEKHNVSRLIGAPPGYVGYDEVRPKQPTLPCSPMQLVAKQPHAASCSNMRPHATALAAAKRPHEATCSPHHGHNQACLQTSKYLFAQLLAAPCGVKLSHTIPPPMAHMPHVAIPFNHAQGGQLTEAVRRRPYSVILVRGDWGRLGVFNRIR